MWRHLLVAHTKRGRKPQIAVDEKKTAWHMWGMTHAEIIKQAGFRQISNVTGVKHRTVKSWRERNSIPGKVWAALAEAGIASLETLAEGARA